MILDDSPTVPGAVPGRDADGRRARTGVVPRHDRQLPPLRARLLREADRGRGRAGRAAARGHDGAQRLRVAARAAASARPPTRTPTTWPSGCSAAARPASRRASCTCTTTSRTRARRTRSEILADHRGRRDVLLDQALPRVRAGQQPDVPVLGRRDDRAAARPARSEGPARDRRRSSKPTLFFSRPHAVRRDGQPARRGATTTCRSCACASPPPSRSRPRCCAAGRRLRPRHRRRHRLHRDAPHLLLEPARRRPPRHERQAGARATSWCCSTSRASRCADGEVGNLHVRGDSALAYYWHQHEKTKAAIRGELVLHRRPLPGRRRTATTSTRAAPTT